MSRTQMWDTRTCLEMGMTQCHDQQGQYVANTYNAQAAMPMQHHKDCHREMLRVSITVHKVMHRDKVILLMGQQNAVNQTNTQNNPMRHPQQMFHIYNCNQRHHESQFQSGAAYPTTPAQFHRVLSLGMQKEFPSNLS